MRGYSRQRELMSCYRILRAVAYIAPIIVATTSLATTVVVFMTPSGIVMGADSKSVLSSSACFPGFVERDVEQKLFPIDNRFVVAVLGNAWFMHVSITDGIAVDYSTREIISRARKLIKPDTSVVGLVKILSKQAELPITNAVWIMAEEGRFEPDNPTGGPPVFVDFLVAGYEGRTPVIYELIFQVNRQTHSLSSNFHLAQSSNPRGYALEPYGIGKAIMEIVNPRSLPHKRAFAIAPREMQLAMDGSPVTLKEAETVVTTMVKVQSISTPESVGPPIHVALLPAPHQDRDQSQK
jgi:hypothetical protein